MINSSLKIMVTAFFILGAYIPAAFAQAGEDPDGFTFTPIFSDSSLDLNDNGFGVTFSGNGGYSADGIGADDGTGTVSASIPAGSTIEEAFLYASTYDFAGEDHMSVMVDLDGTTYTLSQMTNSEYDGCCDLRAFKHQSPGLDAQVAAKFVSDGPGVISFATSAEVPPDTGSNTAIDGIALVVIFSNPASPEVSVAVLDGGLSVAPATTTLVLADPLDTTGLVATLALGIGFGFQGSTGDPHDCSGGQRSSVDINTMRLTTCAGGSDDRASDEPTATNGNLFTVGGFDDSTANPVDPFGVAVDDDELYNIVPFTSDGDTQIDITTENFSEDDIIFLSIIEINRVVTVDPMPVGGDIIPLDTTALLLAGTHYTAAWLIPVIVSVIGIGIVLARKF